MNANILVVDDDTAILDGFKELLEKERYTVDVAANEREAVANLKQQHYHIVLMDIVLKETTGIELIRKIQEKSEDTVIIMITAYPSAESAISCFQAGAFDYLIKPIRKSDLLKAIERGCERKKEEQEINTLKRLKEASEKSNNEKTLFLMQVSHDIHTIMDGITGYTNFLSKTKINEKQVEYLSVIKMNCNFLRNLADNVLDIAKVDAGKLNLKEEDFELSAVIKDVARIIYPLIKEKHPFICPEYFPRCKGLFAQWPEFQGFYRINIPKQVLNCQIRRALYPDKPFFAFQLFWL